MERKELKEWLEDVLAPSREEIPQSECIHVLQALVELSNAELLATCIGKNTAAIQAQTKQAKEDAYQARKIAKEKK